MNKKLTIFTPTFNRAYILPKLYNSLINQSDKNFCWLIVDDGSKDNTLELVKEWQDEKLIEIEYIKQENAGKMQAHNVGVKECKTEFFICVDSDDYLSVNAVKKLNLQLEELQNEIDLAGCIFYRGKSETEILTKSKFPKCNKIKIGTLYDNGFIGDTSILLKTSILKNYLFPKVNNEKFIPEEYLYLQLDNNYFFRLKDEIIIICHYQSDGYTNNSLNLILKNIKGVCLSIDYKIGATKKLNIKIKNSIRYIGFAKLANYKDAYKNSNHKFLYIVCYFLGWLYYKKKKRILDGKTN